jgi:hypothetical protein
VLLIEASACEIAEPIIKKFFQFSVKIQVAGASLAGASKA